MRILTRLGVAGFALFLAALVAFFVTFDRIAGASIERGASYALGVDTQVGFVRVGLLAGTLRIASLAIDNPPGFEADDLLAFGDGRLRVSLDSLRRPVVEVPSLVVDDVTVALEKSGGQTNFGVVLANLKRFESSGSPPAPGGSGDAAPEKRFIVRQVVIRNVAAHVEPTAGVGAVDVTIPEIRLSDVGAHNARGVVMSELSGILVKAVFTGIVQNGAGLPEFLLGDLRSGLGGLSKVPIEVLGATAKSVTDALPGEVGESVRKLGGEAGKQALDGIGRLLGGGKQGE